MMLECNLSYHLGSLLAGVSQRTYVIGSEKTTLVAHGCIIE